MLIHCKKMNKLEFFCCSLILLLKIIIHFLVIILCASPDTVREIMLAAYDLGMATSGEYVFINIDVSTGFFFTSFSDFLIRFYFFKLNHRVHKVCSLILFLIVNLAFLTIISGKSYLIFSIFSQDLLFVDRMQKGRGCDRTIQHLWKIKKRKKLTRHSKQFHCDAVIWMNIRISNHE